MNTMKMRIHIEHISEGYKIVEGKVLISEVNDLLGIHLIADDVDTIGGWIMVQNKSLLKEILLRNTVFILKSLKGYASN